MIAKDPLVSIITTTYNSENTVLDTINSINSQSYKSIEHVFIDGMSRDKTCKIIRGKSKRLPKLISEKDFGLYDAMNKGIMHCKGDFVFILNSDDILFDKKTVENIVNLFLEKNADIVYGGMLISTKNDLNSRVREWMPTTFRLGSYAKGWHCPHPGFVVKREVYKKIKIKFKTHLKIAADFELMLRLMENPENKTTRYPRHVAIMRAGGASSSIKGILSGFKDINIAFKENNIKVNMLIYAIIRYSGKLKQLTKYKLNR